MIAVIADAICVIKDGKLVNKQVVKYQPLSVAISVDETQVAVGGKVTALSCRVLILCRIIKSTCTPCLEANYPKVLFSRHIGALCPA